MREVSLPRSSSPTEALTLRTCIATILELTLDDVPAPEAGENSVGWRMMRWLAGLGLVPVSDASSFSWAGPWIGWARPDGDPRPFAVVMYGVPSGVAWDPARATDAEGWRLDGGYVLAALDIAQARPPAAEAPISVGTLTSIYLASHAGDPVRSVPVAHARAGRGLDGDRYIHGAGTFPSGLPGTALTLIQAEVCESFTPPLEADEHRRNIVTRGIDLNRLVGHEFMLGAVRCRGTRLCEPCRVVAGYATRPILRPLVHRGGLRADILQDGTLYVGDQIRAHHDQHNRRPASRRLT